MRLQASTTALKINLEGWMPYSPQESYTVIKKFTKIEIKKIYNTESEHTPPPPQISSCSP